jgi:hypothetical protein
MLNLVVHIVTTQFVGVKQLEVIVLLRDMRLQYRCEIIIAFPCHCGSEASGD